MTHRGGGVTGALGGEMLATNDLLRDLENLGYLRLERDPSDGRARIIRYTDRGWKLYHTGSRTSRDIGRRWARAIGQRRYDQFEATLRAIVELGGEGSQVFTHMTGLGRLDPVN
jgi:hypothetical protein